MFIDTHGHPAGYPFIRLFPRVPLVCYTHYPVISTDMIERVREARGRSVQVSRVKVLYYHLLLKAYGLMGRFITLAFSNSSWTKGHLDYIWRTPTNVLYPPCNVTAFLELPLDKDPRKIAISIGQFRPEKDHELQIEAFRELQKTHPDAELWLVGSCSKPEDERRVAALQRQAEGLPIHFHVNVTFETLLRLCETATVGIHSMWNEHFGIAVVELMASGLITIAHDSGGPRTDIIKPGVTGFLANTQEEYTNQLNYVFNNLSTFDGLKQRARESVMQYSDEKFEENFALAFSTLLNQEERDIIQKF